MRIPTSKIYRAFEELDEFSDEQCERLMRRVRIDTGATSGMVGFVFLATILVFFTVWFLLYLVPVEFRGLSMRLRPYFDLDMVIWFLTEAFAVAATGFATRDYILRKHLRAAIELRIERVRCPDCKYILIGQRPRNDMVACPECGTTTSLGALGVTANDLIPPTTPEEEVRQRVGERTATTGI